MGGRKETRGEKRKILIFGPLAKTQMLGKFYFITTPQPPNHMKYSKDL
jgi:hypothetical protein